MGMDVCWKEYFRDEARYADVINGLGCAGQQLVKGEDLQEADTQTLLGRWYSTLGKGGKVCIRDMVCKVAFGVNFAIAGIENQENIDYAMPLRCLVYDAGEYEKQVFDFIRCSGDRKKLAELVRNDERFQNMEEDAYEVATRYVNAEELIRVKNEYCRKDGKLDVKSACMYLECIQEKFGEYVEEANTR